MTIRPARSGDEAALHGLLVENGLALDGVDYTTWTHPCLVAVRDGELVGMIQAHLGRPYTVITDLAIRRDQHGKGVGVELAKALEVILRYAGVSAYVAFCSDKDDSMTSMLERFGLMPTGHGHGFVRRLL